MNIADRLRYLTDTLQMLRTQWPENRTVNIVCHGHSVPAGYFATPRVDSLNAYPHLLREGLHARFPFASLNVIVTAIPGEYSSMGEARFCEEVLCHRPDVITIDYGLNDRKIGLSTAKESWESMIRAGLDYGAKIILLTPTFDFTQHLDYTENDAADLVQHTEQIRGLAEKHTIGLADSFAAFDHYMSAGGDLTDLLSWKNHPSRTGHELVSQELLKWFPAW